MKATTITLLLMLISTQALWAQVEISGTICAGDTGEPMRGVSAVVRDADGKIKKFASTDSEGKFKIRVPTVEGYSLEVSMISFAKQTIPLAGATFPLTIKLEPSAFELKEVAVKADRIREQGDTIIYNVGSFAQKQDRNIGDVLKRMPGIDVSKSGQIKYQGEDINKFYIEGSDLLGGKYGVATNGIDHEDVGSVEVMENHQPMQVLSGISFSDKAAINLKLKEKAKAKLNINGEGGIGYSGQPKGMLWDARVFAMTILPSFQNISTFRSNNTGDDLSWHTSDLSGNRLKTGISRYLNLALPSVPALGSGSTLFNRSAMISTNNLWKIKNGEIKAQIDYLYDHKTASASNISTYFLPDGNRVVTENRDGTDRSHTLTGKFVYESNRKTAFVNNTLQAHVSWDDLTLAVTGSLQNSQTASLPDYYVGNDFKLIKRFGSGDKTHLVTIRSNIEWESLPQTLKAITDGTAMSQHIGDHAFYTQESAAYAFTFSGITLSLEGGLKGYLRSMRSDFTDMTATDGATINTVNTNYFTVYAKPKFEYWLNRVNLSLDLPLSFSHYTFDKALANRSEGYFSPALSANWKPNNRFAFYVRAGLGRSPMSLNMIQPGFIMTDYRSFSQGVDDFYNTSSQSLSARMSFKHTRRGIFADANISQSWSHVPFTMIQQLYGDYIVYSYAPSKNDSRRFSTSGKVSKTLDFMRGSVAVRGSYSRSESQFISGNDPVESVGTSWTAGADLTMSPIRWLSLDYNFSIGSNRLSMNGSHANWLSNIENRLSLNIFPHKKWEVRLWGNHFRNQLTADQYKNMGLLNARVAFKLSKQIELTARLNNLLDQRTYSYTTYNDLNSFESLRYLRGREFLISISLKK